MIQIEMDNNTWYMNKITNVIKIIKIIKII